MKKNRFQGIFSLVFLTALLFETSACTTALVNNGRYEAGDPLKELGAMEDMLEGIDFGNISLQGVTYRRLLIPSARYACSSTKPVELLLPLYADSNERAIVREVEGMDPSTAYPRRIPIYDSIGARPPVLIQNKAVAFPTNEDILTWLDGIPVSEKGLSAVVFSSDSSGDNLVVLYNIGVSPLKARMVLLKSDLDWVCRSRLRYALLLGSYPFAVALDIVTFPIQLAVYYVVLR